MGADIYADKELTDDKSTPNRAARIRSALELHFTPESLDVIDESDQHAGHAGAAPSGETHFRVRMRAPGFANLTRVARQRAVMTTLQSEFDSGLHALALELSA